MCVCVSARAYEYVLQLARLCVGARKRTCACARVAYFSNTQSACAILSYAAFLASPFFRHCLVQGMIFGEKLLNIKCVFWFSLQRLFGTRRIHRDIVTNVKTSSCKKSHFIFGFWWNLNTIERFSGKNSNIKYYQNPSSGSRVVPCRRTDGWTWRN